MEKRDTQNNDSVVLSSFTQVTIECCIWGNYETRAFSINIMGTTIIKFWGYHSSLNFFPETSITSDSLFWFKEWNGRHITWPIYWAAPQESLHVSVNTVAHCKTMNLVYTSLFPLEYYSNSSLTGKCSHLSCTILEYSIPLEMKKHSSKQLFHYCQLCYRAQLFLTLMISVPSLQGSLYCFCVISVLWDLVKDTVR